MIARRRLQRWGVAFAIAGLFLSTVDVNAAGEIAGAYAAEGSAQPESSGDPQVAAQLSPSASDSPGPQAADLTHLAFTATDGLAASLITPADDAVADGMTTSVEVTTVAGAGVELKVGADVIPSTEPHPVHPDGGAPDQASIVVPTNMPYDFVITRLHARYTKSALGEDLVFKKAQPAEGGRGMERDGPQTAIGSPRAAASLA